MPSKRGQRKYVPVLTSLNDSDKYNRIDEQAQNLYDRILRGCDDYGNITAEPDRLAGEVYLDMLLHARITVEEVGRRLTVLASEDGLLVLYEAVESPGKPVRKWVHVRDHFSLWRADRIKYRNCPPYPGGDDRQPPDSQLPDTGKTPDIPVTGLYIYRDIYINKDKDTYCHVQPTEEPMTAGECVALRLIERIMTTDPNDPNAKLDPSGQTRKMQTWGKQFDTIMRVDKVSMEQLYLAIDNAHRDCVPRGANRFCWSRVVQSPEKVRYHFSKLLDLRVAGSERRSGGGVNVEVPHAGRS
jgi:hypothetical protein